MKSGLTPRLADLLEAIRKGIKQNGMAPSYTELAAAIGICSRGAVGTMVDRLEERGFVRRIARSARSITVVDQSGLSPEMELRVADYCRARQISRGEFDRRAAERQLRSDR